MVVRVSLKVYVCVIPVYLNCYPSSLSFKLDFLHYMYLTEAFSCVRHVAICRQVMACFMRKWNIHQQLGLKVAVTQDLFGLMLAQFYLCCADYFPVGGPSLAGVCICDVRGTGGYLGRGTGGACAQFHLGGRQREHHQV